MYRKTPPAQEGQALLLTAFFKADFFAFKGRFVRRKKESSDSVIPLSTKRLAYFSLAAYNLPLFAGFVKKIMANLKKNSNTISCFSGSIFTRPVFQFFYNAEGAVNNSVRFASVNVYNRTNSAVVVFKRWLI